MKPITREDPLVLLLQAADAYRLNQCSETQLRQVALDFVSQDENVIPLLLELLQAERRETKHLVTELNSNLSMQLMLTQLPNTKSTRAAKEHAFGEARTFYETWRDRIGTTLVVKGFEALEEWHTQRREAKAAAK